MFYTIFNCHINHVCQGNTKYGIGCYHEYGIEQSFFTKRLNIVMLCFKHKLQTIAAAPSVIGVHVIFRPQTS